MKKQKFMLLGLATLLSSFALSGCGPSANDKLVIGLECHYAPFNWTETASNEHTLDIFNKSGKYADGYDIQIAKLIGQHMNKEVVIMQTVWDSLIPDLQMNTIDLVIAGMTDTEERRQSIDFSNEYYRSELVLIVKKEVADANKDKSLTGEELNTLIKDKIIVSQKATVTDDVIDIFANDYGAVHANPLKTFPDAAHDVSANLAFAMTAELPVAQAIVNSKKDLGIIHINQSILGKKQAELGVSIGLKKGNTELINSVNEALATITNETRTQLMIDAVNRSSNY